MEKRRQRLVNCVEGHNIWHGLGKDFVAVMDHWWSFPWLLSPTNTKVADAAWKQVVPSLASLRYAAPRCYPMLNVLPFGKYFPHTRSHMTPPLKQGRVGAGYRRGWRNRARKAEDRKYELISRQGWGRTEGPAGSSPTERKPTAEKKCHSTWKAQTSRNAIKRVILSNDIIEPLLVALPNIIIRSFWHSEEAEPFLPLVQAKCWCDWPDTAEAVDNSNALCHHATSLPPLFWGAGGGEANAF